MTPKYPTSEQFLAAINATDLLTVAVRGVQCVRSLLAVAVSEALPVPHAVELHGLSFPLLVDLASGLGAFSTESCAVALSLNRIRNKFAHDAEADFTTEAARDLFNTLSDPQRAALRDSFSDYSTPKDVLRECLAVVFVELESRITNLRDDKVRMSTLHEMVEAVLSTDPDHVHQRETIGARQEAELEARVARERSKRRDAGEL